MGYNRPKKIMSEKRIVQIIQDGEKTTVVAQNEKGETKVATVDSSYSSYESSRTEKASQEALDKL